MAYNEYLESIEKIIKIEDKGLKITEDPLLLVNYIKNNIKKEKKEKRLLDIGAGQGIISIMLSEFNNLKIDSVEIQKEIFKYLEENIKNNNLETKITPINKDIKDIVGGYDYIVSNPPYKKLNSGKLPKDRLELTSKYEEKLTLKELFIIIKKLLKNYGEFFVIIPDYRLNNVLSYIYKNDMNVLKMAIKDFGKRKLIIIHGKKGGEEKSKIDISIL